MSNNTRPQLQKGRWIRRTILLCFGLSVLAVIGQGIALYVEIQRADVHAEAIGKERVANVLVRLQAVLERVEKRTDAFARDVEKGKVHEKNLLVRLKEESCSDDFLLGYTVAYARGKYPPKPNGLYAPYYDRKDHKLVQCEDFYDYTDEARYADAAWYLKPVQKKKATWVTGYGPAARTTYVGYSVPVYHTNKDNAKELLAVVNVSISLRQLSDLINTKLVGRFGTALMINENGVLLAHPNEQALRSGKTWLELLEKIKISNKAIYELPKRMREGQSGHLRFRNFRGFEPPQSGWLFYRPVPTTTWSLGVAIFQNELYQNQTILRRQQIGIGLSILLAFVLLAASFLRTDSFDLRGWTIIVLVFTAVSVGLVGYIWYLALSREPHGCPSQKRQIKVSDLNGLNEFIANQKMFAERTHQPPPTFIPTRIFIRGIEFENSNNVKLSGYVWQTYPVSNAKTKTKSLKQGFTFLDVAPDAEALSIEETFREQRDGSEVVGWKFRVTLRLKFSYTQYPFETQRIIVRVKHVDEANNVILVPDLLRYRFMNTGAEPGVYHDLVLRGWKTKGSYFSYELTKYDVEFGLPGTSDVTGFPEFQFNICIQRKFLTPFISHIVPIFIVMILLYGVVVMSSLNEEKQSFSGFNVFGVLGTCGAFFFTIALMHIDFRSKLDVEVVSYLESLYIIGYLMLMGVSVNALLFIATDAVAIIEYRDNVIAKLFYWPLFLMLVLGVTVWTFY